MFPRQQPGYRLSEDKTAWVKRAEEMKAAVRSSISGMAKQPKVSKRARMATAGNLATALILPALPALSARDPKLSVDPVKDIRLVNLHRRDADLTLRMVKPDRKPVTLQRLGTIG